MNAGTVLVAVGLVLTVAGSLGVAYAVFRSTAMDKTLELFRTENAALGAKTSRLEDEVVRERERRVALEAAVAVLRETISGEAAVRALGETIAREEAARRDEHRAQMERIDRILAKVAPA